LIKEADAILPNLSMCRNDRVKNTKLREGLDEEWEWEIAS